MNFEELLNKGEIMQHDQSHRTSISDVIYFYKSQLERFYKIGIGNRTEYNTVVSDRLLDATLRRLTELQGKRDKIIYDAKDSKNGIK